MSFTMRSLSVACELTESDTSTSPTTRSACTSGSLVYTSTSCLASIEDWSRATSSEQQLPPSEGTGFMGSSTSSSASPEDGWARSLPSPEALLAWPALDRYQRTVRPPGGGQASAVFH